MNVIVRIILMKCYRRQYDEVYIGIILRFDTMYTIDVY